MGNSKAIPSKLKNMYAVKHSDNGKITLLQYFFFSSVCRSAKAHSCERGEK